MRRATECLLVVSGVLVCLYGLFAVLYEGDAAATYTADLGGPQSVRQTGVGEDRL